MGRGAFGPRKQARVKGHSAGSGMIWPGCSTVQKLPHQHRTAVANRWGSGSTAVHGQRCAHHSGGH